MANFILNASLVDHADGWWRGTDHSAVEWVADGNGNGGALRVTATAGFQPSAVYRPGGALVSVGAVGTIDVAAFGASPHADNWAMMLVTFYDANFGGLGSQSAPSGFDGVNVGAEADDFLEFGRTGITVPVGSAWVVIAATAYDLNAGAVDVRFADIYVGGAPVIAPPYAAVAIPRIQNWFINGDFETSIAGWGRVWNAETVVRDTVSPLSGAGSMKVTTPGANAAEGVLVASAARPMVVPGDPFRFSFSTKGPADLKVYFDWAGTSDATVWTGSIGAGVETVSIVGVVPSGAYAVAPNIFTQTAQAVTFSIDDVTFERTEAFSAANIYLVSR